MPDHPREGELADALVIFGITGDLAYKKIFPALENLERRGRLPPLVIGVARGGVTREAVIERMHASLADDGGSVDPAAVARLADKLRHVDGDYRDARTFQAIARRPRGRATALPLPCHPAQPVRGCCRPAWRVGLCQGCARHRRKTIGKGSRERTQHQPRLA